MEFDEVIHRRRSVRNYSGRKIGWKDVLDAIDVAIQSPFAGNMNNFKFIIIEDASMISNIAAFCEQLWIDSASIIVLVCSDDKNLENMYGERGRVFSRQQAGAVVQTFLLKLADLGIGGCWVGAYSDDLLRSKLDIPQEVQIEALIPIGYPSGPVKKKAKKNLENVLYWERWRNAKRPAVFKESREDFLPK